MMHSGVRPLPDERLQDLARNGNAAPGFFFAIFDLPYAAQHPDVNEEIKRLMFILIAIATVCLAVLLYRGDSF